MEIAQNHPSSMPFVEAVGKLFQNFGAIEMLSYDWIKALQQDHMVYELSKRASLRDRVEITKRMIARSSFLSDDQREKFAELWAKLIPHLEIRNIVAHNPVAMGFPNNDATQPAAAIGVLNMKPKDRSKAAELVSVAEISGSVDATHALGSEMHSALKAVQAAQQSAS